MFKRIVFILLFLTSQVALAQTDGYFSLPYGKLLPGSSDKVGLWWASSGWKISQTRRLAKGKSNAIKISAARNESEAAQVISEFLFTGLVVELDQMLQR